MKRRSITDRLAVGILAVFLVTIIMGGVAEVADAAVRWIRKWDSGQHTDLGTVSVDNLYISRASTAILDANTTAGTVQAGEVIVAGATKNLDSLLIVQLEADTVYSANTNRVVINGDTLQAGVIEGPSDKTTFADTVDLANKWKVAGTEVTSNATELNLLDGAQAVTAVFAGGIPLCTLRVVGLNSTSQLVGPYVASADSGYGVTITILNTDSAIVRRPSDDATMAGLDTVRALYLPNL